MMGFDSTGHDQGVAGSSRSMRGSHIGYSIGFVEHDVWMRCDDVMKTGTTFQGHVPSATLTLLDLTITLECNGCAVAFGGMFE
jgi:hypothetical protein